MKVHTCDECCGNCEYHERLGPDYFVCSNEESEGYAIETMFTDCCDEYKCRYDDDYE